MEFFLTQFFILAGLFVIQMGLIIAGARLDNERLLMAALGMFLGIGCCGFMFILTSNLDAGRQVIVFVRQSRALMLLCQYLAFPTSALAGFLLGWAFHWVNSKRRSPG